MIKINTNGDNWDEIVDQHNKYFRQHVVEKFNENDYIGDPCYKIFKRFLGNLFREDIATKKLSELESLIIEYDRIVSHKYNLIERRYNTVTCKNKHTCTDKTKCKKVKGCESKNNERIKKEQNKFYNNTKNLFEKIFSYENFVERVNNLEQREKPWNRHVFLTKLGTRTCVYCNHQYISNYYDETKKKEQSTADLDHFYSQEKYPFLALCLYNFIPSCQICNSRLKAAKNEKIIYPYEESFGKNAKFKYEIIGSESNIATNMNMKIALENHGVGECREKIEASKKMFKLEERYQIHTDYIEELIIKNKMYNEILEDNHREQFKGLFNNEKDMFRHLVGNYVDEESLSKRPLAKLTKDICEQLDLIQYTK